jgi:5'-3' exonuclease
MGIPKLFSYLRNHILFKQAISRNLPKDVDIFAIDANSIIHNNVNMEFGGEAITLGGTLVVSQEDFYARKYRVFHGIFKDIIGLTSVVQPKTSLLIHIDGVAPQAKINQQRNRRYKGAADRKPTELFDRNAITPGTDFMRELDVFLRQQLDEVQKNISSYPGAQNLPDNIIYSSYLVPGEGEHKIADHLRKLKPQGKTVVIHGSDADLMMIYLMFLSKDWSNIFLFREHTNTYQVETSVDLRALQTIVVQLFPGVDFPVDDFVVILFLIGNDFLPHFPVFERIHDALDSLIQGYSLYVKEGNQGITTGSGIDWQNFSRFLEYITLKYNDVLLQSWATNGDGKIKFPSLVAERCVTKTQQIIGTTSQCVRTFDTSKFKTVWYTFIFSPKTGAGVVTPTEEDTNGIINNYLEGVTWVYNYYRYGAESVNVGWYYAYHYAPLFSDLYSYINQNKSKPTWEIAPLHFQSSFVSPLEQLVMVLPPKSITIIPEPLRILLSEKSPIYDLCPETFLVDTQGKMEEWQGVALLPIPNPIRVIRVVASLNLPIEYVSQFEPIEPYVINKNIVQSFRVRGGGRGQFVERGRGRGYGQSQPRGRGYGQSRERGGGYGQSQPRGREGGYEQSQSRGRGYEQSQPNERGGGYGQSQPRERGRGYGQSQPRGRGQWVETTAPINSTSSKFRSTFI